MTQAACPTVPSDRAVRPQPLPDVVCRARLGVILPSVNTVVEVWFNQMLPEGVSLHATRMLLDSEITAEALRRMDHTEGMTAAQRLASCRPHAIAYGCTASSVVQGSAYDEALRHELEGATSRPCCTAAGALVDALRLLGARAIAIASPYNDVIGHAERRFFEDAGFRVVGEAHLGISDAFELARPTPEEIRQLALRAWSDAADVLVISCLNMNSHGAVAALERVTGHPAITSTTATLWKLLRMAGVNDTVHGYGQLLSHH
ncbi:maleate cis-trans isomerase family protein [Hydrogenophaga palleronii]|uniref:maleate cis-trans isomerase family protein n=1 Tax=Hydrogenophaga palleronii TaxID=65655 RepID=UPI000825EC40|nr:hypothetical protein [Hydrogenophaga palleronii]